MKLAINLIFKVIVGILTFTFVKYLIGVYGVATVFAVLFAVEVAIKSHVTFRE